MREITLSFYDDLLWQSDWNGYELGYDDISVVGLYSLKNTELNFYIDMDKGKILDGWNDYDYDLRANPK
jgi:hypothetical protein